MRIMNLTRLKIHLLGWTIALSFTACYKSGGELIIIDHPPVVGIDTTVITYATNLKVGNSTIPADTVVASVVFNSGAQSPFTMNFEIAEIPTCFFGWNSFNQNQKIEGIHTNISVLMLSDTSISMLESWILDGMDPNINLQLDFNVLIGQSAEIAISEVVEGIRRDTSPTGEVTVIDRARVVMSGLLIDPGSGQFKDISGDFICNFSHPE